MYANLVTVRIDTDFNEALKGLREQVLPQVKQAPGLVAGYWMHPQDDQGISIVIFETEQQAQSSAQMVQQGSSPMPGITIISVETREVVASL